MKLLGPINDRWGYHILVLESDVLTAIKLGYKSILKDAINSQIPFLYTNHFKNLIDLGGNKLKMKYSSETYNKKEIKSIEVLKGKT